MFLSCFIFIFRKRNRSTEEEDFLPLSKKINNLHINNWGNIENPPDPLATFQNASEQWLSLQHENESRDSSPFDNAQDNFQQSFNETDVNERFKPLNDDSYHSNSFSQFNYGNGECNSQDGVVQNGWSSTTYSPDLNMEENPYYYEKNKLLFELYVARLQRGGY